MKTDSHPRGSTAAVVERAREGDRAAFAELVARFQDMAVGTAFGWLREIELAREVAQEAFADAYRLLGQLEEPAAFPGWLRRIVQKHCDRITRRGRLTAQPGETGRGGETDPETQLLRREENERLRRCVEDLPPNERVLVALHYFAGEPQPEIASFLELPLSTVKKRLRDARARLKEGRNEPMDPTPLRPSESETFTDTVRLYLALRAGDGAEVSRLVERDPRLLEAEQAWELDLVRDGVLPFATRANPLITAVERGDRAMVELLLARGAAPDGTCGCAAGEAALWAATLLDRSDLAALLLEAGADPNRRARSGTAPLHLAAMRGYAALAGLLVAHGADPELHDRENRTPADWARAKGHTALAVSLGGTANAARELPAEAAASSSLFSTGIKAVDLLVPLRRGSLVRVPFRSGVGMVVLLTELCERVTARGGVALWTGFAQGAFDPTDLRTELAESGLADRVGIFVAPAAAAPDEQRDSFESGLRRAESAAQEGRDVFVVVLTEEGFEADVDTSLSRLRRAPGARVTAAYITPPRAEKRKAWSSLRAPFDAQIVLQIERARQALFPALDPARCLTSALEHDVSARHAKLATDARSLLLEYGPWDPDLERPDPRSFPPDRVEKARRAQRLLLYLTQPFLTTEPFHGLLAREVPLDQTLDHVEAILAGRDFPTTDAELIRAVRGPRQQRVG